MSLLLLVVACSEPPPPAPPPAPALPYVAPPAGAIAAEVLTDPPTFGQSCTDSDQCPIGPHQGRCYCTAPLPEGGAPATGFCWNGLVKTGSWWCLVEGGVAVRMGVIFP
jgi:hypothetical protein